MNYYTFSSFFVVPLVGVGGAESGGVGGSSSIIILDVLK